MGTHGWLKSLIMLATSDDVQYSGMFTYNHCAYISGLDHFHNSCYDFVVIMMNHYIFHLSFLFTYGVVANQSLCINR